MVVALDRLVFLMHGMTALAVGIVVLVFPALAVKGLSMANALLGGSGAGAQPFVNKEPFMLVLFGSTMLAMGAFDVIALFGSSLEVKNARCLVGVIFNGGNALLAVFYLLTAPACPGFVLSIIPSDGLFGILYLLAFLSLHRKSKSA